MRAELFSLCTWLGSLHSKLNWAHRSTQPTHVSGRKKEENKPQQTGVQTTDGEEKKGHEEEEELQVEDTLL